MSVVDTVAKKFGSKKALAEALGLDQSALSHWKARGNDLIPAEHQRKILEIARDRGIDIKPDDFFPKAA